MTTFNINMILPALPEIFLAGMALVLLMVGSFSNPKTAMRNVGGLTLVSFVVAFILLLLGQQGGGLEGYAQYAFPYGNGERYFFVADSYGFYIKSLILLASSIAILLGSDYLVRKGLGRFEYYVLMLLSVVGMMLMVSTNHLLMVYMGLELMSFALYILAAFNRDDLKSSEAGLKYFVMGSVASGVLLYGVSLLYGVVGDLSFPAIQLVLANEQIQSNIVAILALVLIVSSMAFKISAAPFHMWTPDVYEGAPTPVTAFMAAAPKVAGFALLIRFLVDPMVNLLAQWNEIVIALSIASMSLGAVMAIVQTNLKRLLAFSSIGHVGFMLIGLVGATQIGVQAILMYLTIYTLMTLGAFGGLLLLRRQDSYVENIEDLNGLAKHAPGRAFMIMLFMFSLAGVPPLAGFFGKFYVFAAAVQNGYTWLAIVGVLLSVVAAYYCLRVVKAMYFDEGRKPCEDELPVSVNVTVVVLAVVVVALIFGLSTLDTLAYEATLSLMP